MAASPEDNTAGPIGFTIKIDGKAIPDQLLVQSIRVLHELNRIPEATFTVLSNAPLAVDFDALDMPEFSLGGAVEIAGFYGDGDEQLLFKGIIVTNRVRLDGQRGTQMELTCRHKAIALTEVRSSQPYQDMTDSDVMKEIITGAGLTADVEAIKQSQPLNLRIGATDWDFLRLLADRNGQVLALEEDKIEAKPPTTPPTPVLTVTTGDDVLELDISVDAHRMIGSSETRSWSESEQKVLDGSSNSSSLTLPGNTSAKNIAKVLSARTHVSSTAREYSEVELGDLADARMSRAVLGAVRGTIKFQGSGAIKPMNMIEIMGLGHRFGGTGFVTAVEQKIEGGKWSTQVRLGLPQDWTSDSMGLAAPAAEALTTPIYGLQVGKVLKLFDSEKGTQCIQVKLPMIGSPEGAEVWARFASPYAADGFGIQFLPEIGDEVLVGFLNADPNAPVVVGSLHNAKAMRPTKVGDDENNIKTIKTRSELQLTFDDENMIITAETPAGQMIVMDDTAKEVRIEDVNGNSIVMDSSGITLKSDKDITLSAGGKVTAEATADAMVKGLNVTCDASAAFTGKGASTAEVSAGGQTTVKGGMVMIN
ncbi:MAG: type VI secretion system tip protein VgrG [Roseobacter sp.]